MKLKFTLANLLVIFLISNLFSQTNQPPEGESQKPKCGTDLIHSDLLKTNPEFRQEQENFEIYYQNLVKNPNSNQTETVLPVYQIPTVVHIIHNCAPLGTDANPTDAEVALVISEASQRFRHSHTGANIYTNPLYGADTEIELCLANVDPSGNYTTGIVRHNDATNNSGTYNAIGPGLNSSYKWDDTKYNNIFIVTNLTNAAGVYMGGFDITIYNAVRFSRS